MIESRRVNTQEAAMDRVWYVKDEHDPGPQVRTPVVIALQLQFSFQDSHNAVSVLDAPVQPDKPRF